MLFAVVSYFIEGDFRAVVIAVVASISLFGHAFRRVNRFYARNGCKSNLDGEVVILLILPLVVGVVDRKSYGVSARTPCGEQQYAVGGPLRKHHIAFGSFAFFENFDFYIRRIVVRKADRKHKVGVVINAVHMRPIDNAVVVRAVVQFIRRLVARTAGLVERGNGYSRRGNGKLVGYGRSVLFFLAVRRVCSYPGIVRVSKRDPDSVNARVYSRKIEVTVSDRTNHAVIGVGQVIGVGYNFAYVVYYGEEVPFVVIRGQRGIASVAYSYSSRRILFVNLHRTVFNVSYGRPEFLVGDILFKLHLESVYLNGRNPENERLVDAGIIRVLPAVVVGGGDCYGIVLRVLCGQRDYTRLVIPHSRSVGV